MINPGSRLARLASIGRGSALAGLALSLGFSRPVAAQDSASRFTFAVVGHVRGNSDPELYPRLDEVVAELKRLKPDLLFLTGDIIWGSIPKALTDRKAVIAQWEKVDAKLAPLGIPIYRVPGNHDIHDPVTRDVFFERYGALPRAVDFRGSRFLLLNTTFTPTGNAPVPSAQKLTKTLRLDSLQRQFVQDALTQSPATNTFLVMHHVLWFEEDDPWWAEVHPSLVKRGVRGVFSGDLGPAMYTHLVRDSIDYFRATLNAMVDKPTAAATPVSLIRTVAVRELRVRRGGRRLGALSGPDGGGPELRRLLPARWRQAFGPGRDPGKLYDPSAYRAPAVDEESEGPTKGKAAGPPPSPTIVQRLWSAVGSPKRLAALFLLIAVVFAGGFLAGRARPTDVRSN
jgi:hypothetical protein